MVTPFRFVVLWTSIFAACCCTAMAGGPTDRLPPMRPLSANPVQRGLFGLPVPQQWGGMRSNGQDYNSRMQPIGNRNCPNGRCSSVSGSNNPYLASSCRNGRCPNGPCEDGQCSTGGCANGQCQTNGVMNCPNGQCGINQTTRRPVLPIDNGWVPSAGRTSRTNGLSNPFRRSSSVSEDSWNDRPVSAPLRDAFGSRYDQRDLDLNSEYFLDRDTDRDDMRSYESTRMPGGRSGNYRSNRSMEVPQDHSSERARI